MRKFFSQNKSNFKIVLSVSTLALALNWANAASLSASSHQTLQIEEGRANPVALGPTIPRRVDENLRLADGPTLPPPVDENLRLADGPTLPPPVDENLRLADGPTLPPPLDENLRAS